MSNSKLISQVKSFATVQGTAGKRGLELLMNSIDHMFEHNDTTPLAWLLNKTDPIDKTRLRAITSACVGGITLVGSGKVAAKQVSGLYIKRGDNAATTELMETLRTIVKDGESFRGARVRKELLGKLPTPFSLPTRAKSIYAMMKKEGVTTGQLIAAIGEVEASQEAS